MERFLIGSVYQWPPVATNKADFPSLISARGTEPPRQEKHQHPAALGAVYLFYVQTVNNRFSLHAPSASSASV